MAGMDNTLAPTLAVRDATAAIDYYRRAFGAAELSRYVDAGRIVHADLSVGTSEFAVKDADDVDPAPDGAVSVVLALRLPDVDAVWQRALDAGGTEVFPLNDHEYGRMGRIADPFGHRWILAAA
jgi:PhnB protein